ncbi:MAG: hypothetical protein JXA22_10760 [Candidatus Thermoplasmatota archaeon]|nr:hypothetical protein [Candidatus Thermoplasmatota archaeon]
MAMEGSLGMRVTSVLALSMGPFMVMADIVAVVIVKHKVVLGFGAPGQVFPSTLGLIGAALWLAGLVFLKWAKRSERGNFSSKARSVFLKGKDEFKCPSCGKIIDASRVEYHERITCPCGKMYDMFQEGPWDGDVPTSGELSSPSKATPMRRESAKAVKRPPRQPSR